MVADLYYLHPAAALRAAQYPAVGKTTIKTPLWMFQSKRLPKEADLQRQFGG